ncbi:MAG: tetratricopeptide repeat protein [Burkholderiales bacterium]|nr:tetratricopeptide repeat protein [Burkholderiales bacterium]
MLLRPLRLNLAIAAVVLAFAGAAFAAPADDLREAQKLYAQGRLQPAMEKVDAYLKAQPREPQGRFLKGLILTEQKKVNEAIQVFTGLTEDFPELPEPYNNLAVLYASLGNYDKAKSALELAIHTHPSYATAHENLGDIYAQLASRAYDRALQLDKNNTTAQVKLAMVKDIFVSPKTAARAEATKVAKAEPAKVEAKAPATQPEPAKVEPAKPEAKAPAPKAEPAKPEAKAPAPRQEPAKPAAAGGGEKGAVTAAIEAWARAWSAKDVKGYLAAYAPDFETPGGEPRAAWEKQRTERIERPKSIEVAVKIQSIAVDGDSAVAVLRQSYRSDTLKTNSTKTLKLAKVGGQWLIKQERVGG